MMPASNRILKLVAIGGSLMLTACFNQDGSFHQNLYRLAHSGEVQTGVQQTGLNPVQFHSPASCSAVSSPFGGAPSADYDRLKALCTYTPAVAEHSGRTLF